MSNRYWVVGATWGGDWMGDEFAEKGIWMMGWTGEQQPKQQRKAERMRVGDAIAIKRLVGGSGEKSLDILHIGIIKGIVLDADRVICTVDWVRKDVNRVIDRNRGCFATVHGPYKYGPWVRSIFCL
jgi:hypothetical protein